MDIRQLKCFDAVLTTGAMVRAAELLGLAQPTVSITIAQLEREIGFTLFKRSKGWLQPTPEAFAFHKSVVQAIDGISRASQSARQIKRLNEGEVSVLCYPGIAWRLMPELISEFRKGRPAVQLKLISRSSDALRQFVTTQNFDVAVIEAPVPHPTTNMEHFSYRCQCALPPKHVLGDKKTVKPKDLSDMPIAMLFPDHSTNHQLRQVFSNCGANLNVVLECDFFASALNFTRCNGGVTIIDPISVSQFQADDLVLREFEPEIEYTLSLVRPSNRARSRLADDFYERLREKLLSIGAK